MIFLGEAGFWGPKADNTVANVESLSIISEIGEPPVIKALWESSDSLIAIVSSNGKTLKKTRLVWLRVGQVLNT